MLTESSEKDRDKKNVTMNLQEPQQLGQVQPK